MAARLLRELEREFAGEGLDLVAASTRSANKASMRLFSKLGYRVLPASEIPRGEARRILAALYSPEDDVVLLKPLTRKGEAYVRWLLVKSRRNANYRHGQT